MSRTFTNGQWVTFWEKVSLGKITQGNFQAFLEAPEAFLMHAQNLEGLSEVFEVQVEGRTVTCAWILANYFASDPSNQEVIDEIRRRHLLCPSRDVAVAAFTLKRGEMATNPSLAIDGVVQTDTNGNQIVGYVNENRNGRNVNRNNLHNRWNRNNRFLVVVS